GPILRQCRVIEDSRVFGSRDLKIIFSGQLLDGSDAVGNRCVSKPRGSREDEDTRRGSAGRVHVQECPRKHQQPRDRKPPYFKGRHSAKLNSGERRNNSSLKCRTTGIHSVGSITPTRPNHARGCVKSAESVFVNESIRLLRPIRLALV